MLDVDALAQEIRRVDGNHDHGAGALAQALMPFLSRALVATPPADSGAPPCWWIDHGSHGQITQRDDDASRAIAGGKRVVRYTASIATPPAEPAVEALVSEQEIDAAARQWITSAYDDRNDFSVRERMSMCLRAALAAKDGRS